MHQDTELENIVAEKLLDLAIPAIMVEVTPIEADIMGAFFEDALSEEDAKETVYD